MATASPSPVFSSLTGIWSLLALRSDIDDIILELLGRFSLEKIYADADKEAYADLILTLLVQLRVIFFIQRLTLPPVGSTPVNWSLGFLVSWEVTLRTVESILQIVLEAREVLWDAPWRDEYVSRLVLSTVQILLLHPKPPPNSRLRDRRDRFARVHRALERVCDNYPSTHSSYLGVCRAIADALRAEPDALTLPSRLKQELPSLTGDLYPLPDCLSSSSVATIVPQHGSLQSWLSQLLGLYDVSQFVVGANIQFAVNTRKFCDPELERASKSSRDAVLHALNRIRLPPYVSAGHLIPMISEDFRIILPDTPSLVQHRHDGNMVDALEALRERLGHRLMIHRVSDGAMMHSVSQITKYIELLDDPSDQLRSASPALYVVNCQECHLLGSSQVRDIANLTLLDDAGGASGVALPPGSGCAFCGSAVTMVREVSLARYTWEHLKPLSPNVEAINAERHLPTQFLLAPLRSDQPRRDSGTASGPSSPPPFGFSGFPQGRANAPRAEPWVDSPPPLGNRRMSETLRPAAGDPPFSADSVGGFEPLSKTTTVTHTSSSSSGGIRALSPPATSDKSRSKWKSRFSTAKKETRDHADSSSLSSATLESQKLEEIDLKSLCRRGKHSAGGKLAQQVKVSLSQDSTYSLFWSQSSIQIWEVSTCPPTFKDTISTDGFCILAAVTGTHVAYMTGDRDRKQTLWIQSMDRMCAPPVEYRIGPTPWCTSMTVSPSGSFVAVGFDRSTVGLFNHSEWQQPRLHRVHARYHQDCKDCPQIATVSFSLDGLVLVCSTRSERNGMIQVYLSHFPFSDFQEVLPCRYRVPLHESEDNGISSVLFQPGMGGKEDIICIATWTQSGVPILVHPNGGHRTEIRVQSSASSNHKGRLGNRIQAAAFSPSGTELVLVNDQGHVYRVSNLGSIPIEVRRVAKSKEFTTKSESFALAYVHQTDEDSILLCWSDSSKGIGYVKKIPIIAPGEIQHSQKSNIVNITVHPSQPELPEFEPRGDKAPEKRQILVKQPVELEASEISPPPVQRPLRMGLFGSLHGKK
ncbi:hypothetical protein Aspvir_003219 [Aspergillus viridinutans]|uniref:WD40 repeat protein n=1 Tax=Aspergillus viridinutans TaxID=75553 RepID=A0A9P3C3T1_ASPVI|nr:uncharacterized protein Aspvir_003219 [Aspergillus viridinutans]GIK07553.1 hypothetical protein Aspvir_003219 [Aspergillus viridinutans]